MHKSHKKSGTAMSDSEHLRSDVDVNYAELVLIWQSNP